ncbi:MAG: YkvA family protein [Bacillota bacterium]
MTVNFEITGFYCRGEWHKEKNILRIGKITGDLKAVLHWAGLPVCLKGPLEAGKDHAVHWKINQASPLPSFLIKPLLPFCAALFRRVGLPFTVVKNEAVFEPGIIHGLAGILEGMEEEKERHLEGISAQGRTSAVQHRDEAPAAGVPWREKLRRAAAVVPDFLILLRRLAKDPRVPAGLKIKIGLALIYVASPVDLVPSFLLGPLGFADDAVVMAWVISGLVARIPAEVIRENWPGRPEALEYILKGHAALVKLSGGLSGNILRALRGVRRKKAS